MRAPDGVPPWVVATLAELVATLSGLHFSEARLPELAAKAERAFAASEYTTWETYVGYLASPAGRPALERLVELLTVGETYFFRHRQYFDVLSADVLPALIARRQHTRQLRLWSAGCATGEEAYSLAVLVRQHLPDTSRWQVTILATDVNRAYLAHAEAGLYTDWSFRETDETFRATYFVREGRRYRVRPEVRRMVRFAHLNLAVESYPSAASGTVDLDLILCRNVLMYLAPEVARHVLARLRAALQPGGWLVLGPSDPQPGPRDGFTAHVATDVVLYRRVEAQPATILAFPAIAQAPTGAGPPNATAAALSHPGWLPTTTAPALAQLTAGEPGAPGNADDGRRGTVAGARPSETLPAPAADRADGASAAEPEWRQALRAARASADLGQLAAADEHCQRAIAAARAQPEPYYLLGTLCQTQGRDDAALAAFRRALYAERAFVPALVALAALHRRAGRLSRARQALQRAQRLLDDRAADEPVLVAEGLTVGRLRDALAHMLDDLPRERSR